MVTSIEDLTPQYLTDALGAVVIEAEVEPVGVGVGLIGQLYRITPTYADGAAGPPTRDREAAGRDRGVALRRDGAEHVPEGMRLLPRARGHERRPLPRVAPRALRATRATTSCCCSTTSATTARPTRSSGIGLADAEIAVRALARLNATWWEHPDLLASPYVRPLNESPFPEAVSMSYDAAWPVALEAYGSMMSDEIQALRRPLLEPVPVVLRPAVRVTRDADARRLARRQPLLHRRSRRPARRGRLAADLGGQGREGLHLLRHPEPPRPRTAPRTRRGCCASGSTSCTPTASAATSSSRRGRTTA